MSKDLIEAIMARRSIRRYTEEKVAWADIKRILEAAMAAPTASNRKPWHFVVVTDRQKLDKLAQLHPYGKMMFQAPLCIAVCGDVSVSPKYWIQDCSAATENLLLAAVGLNLGAVWLGVYPRKERVNSVGRVLGTPSSIVPLNLVPIGFPAEKKEPRTQYNEQRIHREEW